jgi:hypothetical protein
MSLQDGRTRPPKAALAEIFTDNSRERCLREISAVHRGEHLAPGATRALFADVLCLITDLAAIGRNMPITGQ